MLPPRSLTLVLFTFLGGGDYAARESLNLAARVFFTNKWVDMLLGIQGMKKIYS